MEIILGTAQLGLKYGITNNDNKPNIEESLLILHTALDNNIIYFDTARSYGDSEYKIGIFKKQIKKKINIITKLCISNFENLKNSINKSITDSLKNLELKSLDILLLHKFEYLKNNEILNILLNYKNNNIVNKLGVSVYNVEEAIFSLENKNINYLQIPLNILDQRWNNKKFQELVEKRTDVFICIRSIFLQGILINDADKWPKIKNVNSNEYVNKLNKLKIKLNLENKIELCISYAKSINWANGIIFGVDNIKQLNENIKLFNKSRILNKEEVNIIKKTFNDVNEIILNPTEW